MDDNVVAMRKVPEPLSISTYSLLIGGDLYRVRRAVDEDKRGFVTIVDGNGHAVLVFSASFPDERVGMLIFAWRAGYDQGLGRGRREAIDGRVEDAT